MGKVMFTVVSSSKAPPRAVFALLADAATWPEWSPIGSFEPERAAPDGGVGVGAIRRFRTVRTISREEVTEVEPDRRFAYRQLSGIPISDHQAVVELEALPDGTRISWTEQFRTHVPGVRWFLRFFVRRCADGLAEHAAVQRADA